MMASHEMIRKMDLIVAADEWWPPLVFFYTITCQPCRSVMMRNALPKCHPLHPSGMPAFRLIYGRQWSMSPIASINTKHQANVADIASKIVNRCSYFAKISTTRSAHSFIGQYPSLCQHKCKLVFYLVANVRTHQRLHTWIKVSV